ADESSRLVRKTTSVAGERLRRRVCTSRPFITGMDTSITATGRGCVAAWSRNASGSPNAATVQPTEWRSLVNAFKTDASSSSMETVKAGLSMALSKVGAAVEITLQIQ